MNRFCYIALPKKRPRGRPKLTGEDASRPPIAWFLIATPRACYLTPKIIKLNQNTSEEKLLALCTMDPVPTIYSNLEKVQEKAGVIRLMGCCSVAKSIDSLAVGKKWPRLAPGMERKQGGDED